MIKFNKIVVALALVIPVSFSVLAGNNANGSMKNGGSGGMQNNKVEGGSCQLDAMQIEQRELSSLEIEGLKLMREEEKLARDVYQVLYGQTSAKIFNNISQSEQTHMDRVAVFLEAYDIPDPAKAEAGAFSDWELQNLYDRLLTDASVSELAAYRVGALVEEVDIDDLNTAIENTDIAELKTMYTQLRDASYKHLRAFTKQIIAIEGGYTAQVLDPGAVENILSASDTSMQMGNAVRISGAEESASNACFTSSLIVDQQTLQNGSSIGQNQFVNITYQVKADSVDVGRAADWLILANYTPINGAGSWFVRSGDQWLVWDGDIGTSAAAVTDHVLQNEQTIPVFEGVLNGVPGSYAIYIGYRVEGNGLVYPKSPLIFYVK